MAAGTAGALGLAWQGTLGRLVPRALAESTLSQVSRTALALGRIEGTVSNMGSGQPLAGVLIGTAGAATQSDANGRFALDLPAGTYDLRVEAARFIGMTVVGLQVSDNESTRLDLEMIPEHPAAAQAEAIDDRVLALAGSSAAPVQDVPNRAAVASVPATIHVVRNYTYPLPLPPGWIPDVVTMDLDEYLRGVVPSEMPSYWAIEALKAQAVAARSYAVAESYHSPYADICTTTHCQAWNNVHYDKTDQAISATRSVVATYNGSIISAFYFGHCIGQTRNSVVPYCRSVYCAHCAEQHYSTYWGHGIGMCQEGAAGYAGAPYTWNYVQIFKHYYTGINLTLPIRLTAPAPGQLVRGVVLAAAEVSIPPERVEFYLDDQLAAQASTAPWEAKLSTTGLSDGTHTIKAKAVSSLDPSEATVNVMVDNTPPSGTASVAAGWHASTRIPFNLSANGSDAVYVQFSNNWLWEGEDLSHNTGELVDDAAASNGHAWRGTTGTPGTWFGPYYYLLPAAPSYQAYFRLKTSSREPAVDLALLDVADGSGSHILAQRTLSSADLAKANGYEEIPLTFSYGTGAQGGLEFRTWFRGNRDLTLDCVTVFSSPRPLAATLNWDVARRDGEQRIIVRFLDAAGNLYDRAVTVRLDLTPPAMTQQGANAALAQDTVSGLNPASARYSESSDGGANWGPWQALTGLPASPGTTAPVSLSAPAGAANDVRFSIADMAGNSAFTRGTSTFMPIVANQIGG